MDYNGSINEALQVSGLYSGGWRSAGSAGPQPLPSPMPFLVKPPDKEYPPCFLLASVEPPGKWSHYLASCDSMSCPIWLIHGALAKPSAIGSTLVFTKCHLSRLWGHAIPGHPPSPGRSCLPERCQLSGSFSCLKTMSPHRLNRCLDLGHKSLLDHGGGKWRGHSMF